MKLHKKLEIKLISVHTSRFTHYIFRDLELKLETFQINYHQVSAMDIYHNNNWIDH